MSFFILITQNAMLQEIVVCSSLFTDILMLEICLCILFMQCFYCIYQTLLASHLLPMVVFPWEACVIESFGGIQKLDSLSHFTPSVFLRMCKQGGERE